MVRFPWLAVAGLRKEREGKGGGEFGCCFGDMLSLEFSHNKETMELGVVMLTWVTN